MCAAPCSWRTSTWRIGYVDHGVVGRHDRAARIAEDDVDALVHERLPDDLGAGQGARLVRKRCLDARALCVVSFQRSFYDLRRNFGGERPVQISLGASHTAVLTEEGSVYMFGAGSSGQLGLGDNQNRYVPTRINPEHFGGQKPIQVSLGRKHSSVITSNGSVYMFGTGDEGQLGLGDVRQLLDLEFEGLGAAFVEEDQAIDFDEHRFMNIPTLINPEHFGGQRPIQVSLGRNHSAILTAEGGVFVFGAGGILGLGDRQRRDVPTLLYF